jgi:hypothetical protein
MTPISSWKLLEDLALELWDSTLYSDRKSSLQGNEADIQLYEYESKWC